MKYNYILYFFLSVTTFISAQKTDYNSQSISDSLRENANAVVRLNQVDIVIATQRSMSIKKKRVVTVLNENGFSAVEAYENYNKSNPVKNILAIVYDAFGKEIKKIKKSDFRDISAVSGSTLFSDSRYIYLDYTPIQYPFTVVFESETETSNTAFIPQWFPLTNYYVSVEKSVLNVSYPTHLRFKYKEYNFSNFDIQKSKDSESQLSYTASNIVSKKHEILSPNFTSMYPRVMMGLELFHLEGVDGAAKTWKEYGQWFSEKILSWTDDISEETKAKVRILVGNEKDPIAKTKIIYNYLQEKSRYVSIQVGIGGWKPMPASDVDRLGYGDCKALSNYTKSLLKAVDVPSYYVELYGDEDKKDIKSDFVSIQGNHVMLCVPSKDKYIFLECTSQDVPFGYQANFSDDRDVIVLKPEGGEIIRTKIYEDSENTQINRGTYAIAENGDLSGKIAIVSEGCQYDQKFRNEKFSSLDIEKFYKDYWSTINNLKINKVTFKNDTDKISFTENAEINAVNYGNLSANKMMFALNAYNQKTQSVKRIRNRNNPFEIQRGSVDNDEIEITLPANFSIEFLPSNVEINGKFGEYKTEIVKKDNNNIIYRRKFFLKKGLYANTEYDDFRLFMEQISRNDNAKIILTRS